MSVTLCANCGVTCEIWSNFISISQTHQSLFKHPHRSRCNRFLYFSPSLHPIPASAFCLLYPLLLLKTDFNPTKKHIFFFPPHLSLFFSFFPSPSSSLSISFPPQIHYPLSLLLAKVWSILSAQQPLYCLLSLVASVSFYPSLSLSFYPPHPLQSVRLSPSSCSLLADTAVTFYPFSVQDSQSLLSLNDLSTFLFLFLFSFLPRGNKH